MKILKSYKLLLFILIAILLIQILCAFTYMPKTTITKNCVSPKNTRIINDISDISDETTDVTPELVIIEPEVNLTEEPEVFKVNYTSDEEYALSLIYNDEAWIPRIEASEEEFNLLCKLTASECYPDDYIGKRMVAEIVINRALDERLHNGTIQNAIMQKGQFQPVATGAIWSATVTDIDRKAVSEALYTQCFDERLLYFKSGDFFPYYEDYLSIRGNYYSLDPTITGK